MKHFLLDKALEFLVYSLIILWLLFQVVNRLQVLSLYGVIILLLFELLLILSVGYLYRRLLLLPIDLFVGKETKIYYYYGGYLRDDYEFFKKRLCFYWTFGDGKETINLTYPTSYLLAEKDSIEIPPTRKKLKITYYRFSKLLCSWELA